MMKRVALLLALTVMACSDGESECTDNDGDGVTTCAGDCDDSDPTTYAGATEICGDGIANTCSGAAELGCDALGTFVSAKIGSDANPGTRELPVATIGAALTNAVTIGRYPATIILGEGVYTQKVELVNGVSLSGGYQCDVAACTWQRDIFAYDSVIVDVDLEGVVAHAGVTSETVLDGVMVVGSDGTGVVGAAITLDGGSPTLRASRFHGGTVTGDAVAVLVRSTTDAAGVTIYGNEIIGGRATATSAGVVLAGANATTLALVAGNTIRGGDGARSVGLLAANTVDGTLVQHNDIFTGNASGGTADGIVASSTLVIDANRVNAVRDLVGTCTGTMGFCSGITSFSATATITNNIAFGANGPRTAGVVLAEAERPGGDIVLNSNLLDGGGVAGAGTSAALVVAIGGCTSCGFTGIIGRVRNNVLVGGSSSERFGILEAPAQGKTVRPELIENNAIWFAPSAATTNVLYRQVPGSGQPIDIVDIAALNALAVPQASANLATNPLYDATWHELDGSPCANAGTALEAPTRDFDNQQRTGAIDIGPDEAF